MTKTIHLYYQSNSSYKYKQIQIKLRWAFIVIYIIQSIMRSEMCSLHLTHPSGSRWADQQVVHIELTENQ